MKDVTLVNVSFSHPRTVPAGILSIAAVLKRAGHGVTVRDHPVRSYRGFDAGSFRTSLEGADGILGVGCMSDTLPFILRALEGFKAEHPGSTVILGGPGPTGIAGGIIETFPFIDAVVRGEGEATMLELVDAIERGGPLDREHVKGISWRRGTEAVSNPSRERIADLDELPMPLYESIPMDEYSLINVVSSRGCPYQCTFCDVAPLWGRKHCRRGAESIAGEIRYLKERYGKTNFEFTDETFVLKRAAVLDFCAALREKDLGVRWSCTGRVNLVDEGLLEEMASCGCGGLFFGVESGSDAVLSRIKKDFTAGEVIDAMHRTSRHMRAVSSFIWGFPFETPHDLAQTLLVMVYLSGIGVDTRLNRLAPFPLAPLHEEYGSSLVSRLDGRIASPLEPFELSTLPADVRELVSAYPNLFPEFYWFASDALEEMATMVASLDRHWNADGWRTGAPGGRSENGRSPCGGAVREEPRRT
jgi:anaerobic magnesium-protoporphyrin IX monomethyl ester cyclase